MKAALVFNLDDYDENQKHKQACKAGDMVKCLHDLGERIKYYEKYDADKEITMEEFSDILYMHGIDLGELLA